MKIFLLVFSGLLLFDSSQGSIIPQERQIRTLNTTLRTNFSGIYQRKNPCSGSEVETSLYKASHELHHHTKDDCWCDYTHKCSAIIRNFLQTIGNLIKFNNDPTGSFNFYLNTSISQKQRLSDDPNSCESLPTIVIEATDCKIPLTSGSHIPKGESFKYNDAHQFLGEEILPQADFSAQEDCKDQNTVPALFTTQNPTSDWFESEESSCRDDNLKFPTTFSPSGPEDISQAVLYDLSRGTQSKPKFFKTSLKLTPQADPENGTIQPRIHYVATNLLEDPIHGEPSPRPVSDGPGSLAPIPFPEGPNHATISPSPHLGQPPQVSPPVFESSANQNEPFQFSPTVRPKPELSSPSSLTEPTPTPIGKPFFVTTDLPPHGQFSNHPSNIFAPEDQNAVNQINDSQFSFVPVNSQPGMAVKYDADTFNVQTDISSKSTSQNSSPRPTTYSETQPNSLPSLRQTPQEDLQIQVSQPPINFPGHPSEFNGEDLNYYTKLNRPPTVDDLSVESDREIITTNFGNQLEPLVTRDDQFSAQPISPFYPGQLPYESSLPSTLPLPGVRAHEKGSSLTTPLPSLQYESREEGKEESKDRSAAFASQPYVVSNLPYSDSLVTSTPRLGEIAQAYSDSHSGQQPTSNNRFHSSTVTTVEETVTFDQKQTTPIPGIALEQIPENTANYIDPSGSDFASYTVPQQFSSVLPNNQEQRLPSTTPNTDDGSRLLVNPDNTLKSTPNFNYMEFSTADSEISDATLNPNNGQILRMPETSQTVPLPVPQESQLLEPEYDPSNDGLLYMTTPMPYAPNSGTTTLIAPEGKLSSASASITNYRNEYDFQTPSQHPVPANQPPVGYSGQIGSSLPPASDSLVRSDYLPTTAPQPFTGNVDGSASTADNSLTYDPPFVSQFTDSPQQNWRPVNFEKNPSTDSYLDWSEPQIPEGGSSPLPSITPRPEGYALQPVVSTSSKRFEEEQFSTDKRSSELGLTELPRGVFSQEQLKGDQNRRTNPADVYGATEGNFQTPLLSTTPVYSNQSPTEADTKQIFESQIENEFGEQSSKNPLDSLKYLSDSKERLSQENSGPTEQYPSTFPPPNAFPGHIDATTPASFLPQPNREFALNRPSSLADSFVMEATPGKPHFQQLSPNSEQLLNFNSQPLSPGVAVDSSKPQITIIPLAGLPSSPYSNDNFGQTTPVSSSLTVSSTEDLSADSLTTPSADAFSTPQYAGIIANADSPSKYPFQTPERPQFPTSSTPQPSFPIQSLDKSTQTTPPQNFNSFPPISIDSQPRSTDLVIPTPLETPGLSFNQPVLFETNTVRPPTSLPVAEILPTPSYPERQELQYAEEETTPQTYVNDDSHPQIAFDSQSVQSTTSLQETELLSRREESQSNDFGQNPNYEPVAAEESAADESYSFPQRISQQTTSIQEMTTTDVLSSDAFPAESTATPFLEPLPMLPESTAEGEIITTQQQSSHQTPNYANPEFTNSFDPLVSQEISKPNVQISATADRSSAILQQQTQSLELNPLSSTLPTPTVTPEPSLTYPDQPISHNSRKGVADSVESFSSQQSPQGEVDPVHFPTNAESQTVSQLSSNFQQRDDRLSETSPVNFQPYGYHNQPRPIFNHQIPNYYSGNFPPRALQGHYPAPNYMGNPHIHSENYPSFYGQQPMPQISDSQPSPSPPKSESTVQQVTETETTSVSTGPQTQPGPTFSSGEQSAASEERVSGNVPYPQNPANPNGLMMPHIPNYNDFRPQDRYRYFGHRYPVNYDPRLRFPNQQNFPPYYNFPFSYPDQRFVPPPTNQIIRAQQGREMGVPSDGHTFRQQTEERFLMDSRPGIPIRPETGSQPLVSQPAPENQLRNPLLQALHSQLVVPMQDNQDRRASFPGHSDHNEQLSLDRMNGSQIYNAPAGQWNPRINFVNLQQNTALDAPRDVLQPHPHALVPDQTTPSNEPDPASTGRSDNMASPLRNSFYPDRMRSGSGPERF